MLAFSADTMIAVLHDNAVIVSVTRLMINARSLAVGVAFDWTSWVRRRGRWLAWSRLRV